MTPPPRTACAAAPCASPTPPPPPPTSGSPLASPRRSGTPTRPTCYHLE
uniref:Uncharacterized protein n=1 Tax=Arundo donax TaxID=35708 RepID=A0A0A9FGP5_ARUDO